MIQCDALMFDTLYYNLNYILAISGSRFGLLVLVLPIAEPKPIERFRFDPFPESKSRTPGLVMSFLIRYSPMASYFCLSIIFLPPQILWHAPCQHNWSQAITLHGQDLTICFATHEPCACFTYHLYLKLLYLPQKRRKVFPPEFRLSVFCLIISPHSASYLCPYFIPLTHHTILHSPLSCQENIHYPQITPSEPHRIYT